MNEEYIQNLKFEWKFLDKISEILKEGSLKKEKSNKFIYN